MTIISQSETNPVPPGQRQRSRARRCRRGRILLTDRPLRAMPIVSVVLRGSVIPAALTDGPLRAVGVVVITAVRPAADRGLRVTNIADPNTKAPGCLAFLCVCHACRSCLCASLCQAIFSHELSHVLAGIRGSWRNQQRKSKSRNKNLHHRIAIGSLSSHPGLCTGIL